MQMIVKKAKTSLTVGGVVFPVINFQLNLTVNALPQFQVSIPMGDSMGIEGATGEPVDVSSIEEGQDVVFSLTVGDQEIKFEGVVKTASISVNVSNISNSSGSYSITAEHKLTFLGGLAVKDRVFMGKGKPGAVIVDTYRDLDLPAGTVENNILFQEVLSGAQKDDMLLGLMTELGEDTLPGLVIDLIKVLYETESKYRNQNGDVITVGREVDKKAIEQLSSLGDNIIGGIPKKDISTAGARSTFIEKFADGLVKSWGSSNGLDVIMRGMNTIFFSLVPIQAGAVKLRQYCPMYKKETYTISNSDILSISRNASFEATPIAGIRLDIPAQDTNAHSPVPSEGYIVYPTDGAAGLYKYISTTSYDMWLTFASIFEKQKENEESQGETPIQTATCVKGKKKVEQQEEVSDADIKSEGDAITKVQLEVGKAVYAQQKWQNSGIVIKLAWTPYVNPGDIVRIDLSTAKALAANIPKGEYYGYVRGISISGAPGSINMSAQITSVRSKADNDEFGMDEYPIYEELTDEDKENATKDTTGKTNSGVDDSDKAIYDSIDWNNVPGGRPDEGEMPNSEQQAAIDEARKYNGVDWSNVPGGRPSPGETLNSEQYAALEAYQASRRS